ncbi:MAG: Mrp/NBP35 family ATP-binding protein [Clostridia bacterium]|nr:Mrp/NBP35 family ATP-binding protein [Clostridia bacterium]MBQ4575999.1 Mrp/NBP35 family ATP-binding protein [Clostridia bacterium]
MAENETVEGCTHDCSTCGANCPSKNKESLLEPANRLSEVKHVIGIVSGKGGVGKSLVTSMLSVLSQRRGNKTAILDADVTGPSIPKIFNLKGEVTGCDDGMFPLQTKTGIEVMSVNLLLNDEKMPVVWRGPVIAGTVKQFWTDVVWGDVDFMYVDMPPGTGDVPLTVFQSLPLDGIIIVTSPQELVSMIVAKAVNMAKMMNIPVLGIVENMSYIKCPDCGKEISIFGESHTKEAADEFGLDLLARIPLDPKIASLCDKGMLELMELDYLDSALDAIEKKLEK